MMYFYFHSIIYLFVYYFNFLVWLSFHLWRCGPCAFVLHKCLSFMIHIFSELFSKSFSSAIMTPCCVHAQNEQLRLRQKTSRTTRVSLSQKANDSLKCTEDPSGINKATLSVWGEKQHEKLKNKWEMMPLILPPVVNSAWLVNKTQVDYLPDVIYFHLPVTFFLTHFLNRRQFISLVDLAAGFCPGSTRHTILLVSIFCPCVHIAITILTLLVYVCMQRVHMFHLFQEAVQKSTSKVSCIAFIMISLLTHMIQKRSFFYPLHNMWRHMDIC